LNIIRNGRGITYVEGFATLQASSMEVQEMLT
jgi:hypothetical protein